ncbi:MAG: antibiotic biosynthesis monooxygenase [Microbacterium sp.]|uniref:Antibiotic biosynthesis monooxygenase (ABM) superfamily enzyme n=1 Tax=Microbacterium natoriense TaxID=284570 RepID=A0AAW8F447_9MICO|nr:MULTISPECIES: antibiotic biosynthesis monooxygenase [Microbacterium]MBW8762865.1 antibiotic biosynthesis monooxygenase [Microbacterium sp.]MDQ0649649.1 antibiotic biosynthesis monooxygenase (ABM) superfamily enzyme [Microbacterium natoriense]
MSSEPITVSIRREVDPERIAEATAWVQTGVNLAHRYPGFLGSGWVRDGEDSNVWHMLYRFADEKTLLAWEQSGEREWWRATGDGFVRSERARRRSGIEGWFDEPTTDTITIPRGDGTTTTMSVVRTPPRWKQAISIWLGFFPLNVAFTYATSPIPGWSELPIWLRVLGTTVVLTPIMTYWVLPWVTRSLRNWLAR